jgi:hypothetical protein
MSYRIEFCFSSRPGLPGRKAPACKGFGTQAEACGYNKKGCAEGHDTYFQNFENKCILESEVFRRAVLFWS